MIDVNKIKYPTTPEEVQANRLKVIKGLRRYKNQCFGDLYSGKGGQHARCAVGVCGAILFGIKTKAEYSSVLKSTHYRWNIYDAIAEMLGLPAEYESVPAGYEGVKIDDIWRMNDRYELSFVQIADALAGKWDLA
jgi:hypothetical protein